jgi:hypothetical protein
VRHAGGRFHSRSINPLPQNTYYGPLLDQTNVPAPLTAFSLRKIRAAYNGNCMIVQRDSDNATITIAFNPDGTFNRALIGGFCKTAKGFILTMCDQSGNGYDWTARTTSTTTGMYRIWSGTAIDLMGVAAMFRAINASGAANTACDLVSTFPAQTNSAMTVAMVSDIEATVTTINGRMLSLYGASNTDSSDSEGMDIIRVGSSAPTAVWGLGRHGTTLSQINGAYSDIALIDAVINDPAEQIALEGTNGTTGSTSNGAFDYTHAALGWSGNTHASVGGYSEVVLWNSALNSTQLTAIRTNMAGYWNTSSASGNPSGSTGSGTGATNLPGWNLVFDENFNTTAAEGSFLSTYGANWTAYTKGTYDTFGQNPTAYGGNSGQLHMSGYDTNNISVSNNVMQLRDYVDSSGFCWGAAPIPKFPGKDGYHGYQYYRYQYDIFCPTPVQGWKLAALLWPDTNTWIAEIDFDEQNLNGTAGGHNHHFNDTGNQDNYPVSGSSGITLAAWHTFTVEWLSQSLKWYVDNNLVKTMTGTTISATPMHGPIFQNETDLSNTRPIAGQSNTLSIRRVSMWLPA